jgi:alpha-galactosidase/6-phospho-beta-glucosidase family protein
MATTGRIRSVEPVRLPPLPSSLLQAHAAYESLAVQALAPGAGEDAKLRALIANPMVLETDRAVALRRAIEAGPTD